MAEGLDRRTAAYRDILGAMPKPEPTIRETLDGQDFRYLPEPRCRVCSAGDPRKGLQNGGHVASTVDSLLLYPKGMTDIYNTIEPMMADWPAKTRITYKSIRTHLNKHLAWDRLALRVMVERWAQEKGISVLDASGRMILTEEAWLEATAQLGWQRMISGQLEPSWAETQKAFERIASIKQQAEGEYSTAVLLSQLNTVIQIVRDMIPPERMDEFISKIEGHEAEALPALIEGLDDEFEDIVKEQRKFASEEEA